MIQGGVPKREEKADTSVENNKSIVKCACNLLGRACRCRGIWNAPVRSHRMSGPEGTDLLCRVVTHREDKVQLRRIWSGEFIPRLAAKPCR